MNRILKASLLSVCLTNAVCAEATDKAKEATTAVSAEATSNKSTDAKHSAREARKLEKAKKLLENCTADYKDLETKVAAADTNQKKKDATLALAHAKLDLDAAKDSEFGASIMWHTRQCKRHLLRAKDILEGKERVSRSQSVDKAEAKTDEKTTPKA